MRRLLAAGIFLAAASACTTEVAHTNPFDPGTPAAQQAKGVVKGVMDRTSNPAGGEKVTLTDSSGLSQPSVTPDSSGVFSFANLDPGTYSLQIEAQGFFPYSRPNIEIGPGTVYDLGTVTPTRLPSSAANGTVSGQVLLQNGTAAAGAKLQVFLERTGQAALFVQESLCDSQGRFEVSLAPGTYTLVATYPNYFDRAVSGILIESGKASSAGELHLQLQVNPAVVKGKVLVDCGGVTLAGYDCSAGYAPANGATVVVGGGMGQFTVGADGLFEIGQLEAGTRSLQVSLANFHDPNPGRTLTLLAGQTTQLADDAIVMQLNVGALTGMVTLSDARAIASLDSLPTVVVVGYSMQAVVTPDPADPASGSWRLERVPAIGDVDVEARAPGYFAAQQRVTVAPGKETRVPTLQLGAATGEFVIDDGEPNSAHAAGYTHHRDVTLKFTFPPGAQQVRASEDGAFAGVGFGPYSGTKAFTLGPSEGKHTVFAQYQDASGTASRVFSASVIVDTVGPAFDPSIAPLAVEGGAAFTRRDQQLTLTLVAQDDTSGLWKVRLARDPATSAVDAGVPPLANPALEFDYVRDYAYTLPASGSDAGHANDGLKDLYVQFVDRAGNVSPVAHASITVDTIPPQATSLTVDPGTGAEPGYTNSSRVSLHLSATEQLGDGVLVKIAGNAADLSTAIYRPLQTAMTADLDAPSVDGPKDLLARFADLAGNEAPDVPAHVTLDTGLPTISVTVAGLRNGSVTSRVLNLTVVASDSGSGLATNSIQISESPTFSGATWGPYQASASFTLASPDGSKTIYLRARDKAGNVAETSVTLALDTQPPSGILLLGNGTGYSKSLSVPVSLLGAPPDLDQIAIATDVASLDCSTATYAPYTGGLSATFSADGAHTVLVCLMDQAGNRSPAALSGSVFVDGVLPGGNAAIAEAVGGVIGRRDVTLDLTGVLDPAPSSGLSLMQVLVDSASFTGNWEPFAVKSRTILFPAVDGAHAVNVQVRDNAGNVYTAPAVNVMLDTVAPTVTLTVNGLSNGYVRTNPVTLTIAANDPGGSGLATNAMDLALSPSFTVPNWTPFNASPTVTLAGDGPATVYLRVRDVAGNIREASASFILDTQPPTALGLKLPNATCSGTTCFSTVRDVALALDTPSPDLDGTASVAPPGTTLNCGNAALYTQATSALHAPFAADGKALPVLVCLRDKAGNVSAAPLSAMVTVDTAVPTVSVTSPAPNSFAGSNTVAVGVSASDATSGVASIGFGSLPTLADATWMSFAGGAATFNAATAGGDGSRTIYLAVRDAAGLQSATASLTVVVDTTPPYWVAAPSTSVSAIKSTAKVPVTFAAADQLDVTGLQVGFAQVEGKWDAVAKAWVPIAVAPDCKPTSNASFAPFQAAISPIQLTLTGADPKFYFLYACLRDTAGNFLGPTQLNRTVRLDDTAPAAPFVNLVTVVPDGVQLYWTDASADTAYFEVDGSTDKTFATGVTTVATGTGTCDANGQGIDPTQRVAPPMSLHFTQATPYHAWYFRVRAIDCAGNKSLDSSPVQASPNVGSVPFPSAAPGSVVLFADGPDLWAHYPVGDGVSEAVAHCRAASMDCHDPASWQLGQMALGGTGFSFYEPAAMFADQATVFMAQTVTDGANYKLVASWCARSSDCTVGVNWTQMTLRTFASPAAATWPAAATSASAHFIGYLRKPNPAPAGNSPFRFTFKRCTRASGSGCRAAADWIDVDYDLPAMALNTSGAMEPRFRVTLAGSDAGPYLGFRTSDCAGCGCSTDPYNEPTGPGQAGWARCTNGCSDVGAVACGCGAGSSSCGNLGIGRMDRGAPDATPPWLANTAYALNSVIEGLAPGGVAYFKATTAGTSGGALPSWPSSGTIADGSVVWTYQGQVPFDALPPVVQTVGSIAYVTFATRYSTSPGVAPLMDHVYFRRCGLPGTLCHYPGNYSPPLDLAGVQAPAAGRSSVAFAVSGAAAKIAYSDPNARALEVLTYPLSATTNPPVAGDFTYDAYSLAEYVQPSAAAVGDSLFLASATRDWIPQVLTPLVGAPYGVSVGPRLGTLQFLWTPFQTAASYLVSYQPGLPSTPWASSASSFDPRIGQLELTAPAATTYSGTVRTSTAQGPGPAARPWEASAFVETASAHVPGPSTAMAVSLTTDGASPTKVFSGYASSDGITLGQCAVAGSCADPTAWTWGTVNGFAGWKSLQLTSDVPRDWSSGQVCSSTPVVFGGGRWSDSALYLGGCDFAANGCTSTASGWPSGWSGIGPAANTASTLRIGGAHLQATTSDGAGKLSVSYCDGGSAFPRTIGSYWGRAPCTLNKWPGPGMVSDVGAAANPARCLNAANWTTAAPKAPVVLGSGGGAVVGMPHPTWGWVAAQAYSAGFPEATPSIGFWGCVRNSLSGTLGFPFYDAHDCTVATAWSHADIATTSQATALDLHIVTDNLNTFGATTDATTAGGAFISYYDRGWRIAGCYSAADIGSWGCAAYWNGAAFSQAANGGGPGANWSSTLVAPGVFAPIASSLRTINGDLVAAFLENGRMLFATCPGGAGCMNTDAWSVVVVARTSGATAFNGAGILAPGTGFQSFLLDPTYPTGGAAGWSLMSGGGWHRP